MATVEENIIRIQNAKEAIRASIVSKGVQVSEDELIGAYAAHIDSIETGGSEQFIGLIDRTATHIDIPEGTTKIGDFAFYQFTNLQSVTIPNSVTSIGIWAFVGCSSLRSITIQNSVTSIGEYAFSDCYALTSIEIPDSVTSIDVGVFQNCRGLTSITIPDSVTSIGIWAFVGCSSLRSITIPNSVTSIGTGVFAGCSGLKSITCKATTAPIVQSSTFGNTTTNYTGRNTYSTGENTLYIPEGATGYNASYWADPLLDSTKCGFHIEYLQ